jgi:hypothetical protein
MARFDNFRYRFANTRRWRRAERHVNDRVAIWRQGETAQ